ncbi:MAG TPA: hypothetical protein VFI24_01495 [Pyrinomonadaceae bacterium]|nr:hypothetical protein [Pyrinomonadaceae bacterium]
MSLEERGESWALSVVDALESPTHKNVRVGAATAATVVTVVMWIVHLNYPEILAFFFQLDDWTKLVIGVLLAPPFVLAFTVILSISPQPTETNETGPMSAFFYQERSSRRWRVFIGAGLFAALNLLLMLATSGA